MTESKGKKTIIAEKNSVLEEIVEKLSPALNYCYNCNKCVNVCPLSYQNVFYPRRLITDLIHLGPEEALKNSNIWTCLTCGLCMEYCPMTNNEEGVNFLEIILKLRSIANEYKPLEYDRDRCNHGIEYSNIPYLMANNQIQVKNKLGFLKETNLKIAGKGDIGFFLGCLPFMNSIPPCTNACPAGVDVQGYISLISEGKFQEAIDLIREKNPFPLVCGRACTHPCEDYCNRKDFDDPIAIRELKKFISDWEIKNPGLSSIKPSTQNREKVAIIGAGPAGLSAAYFLARMGYKPTVFEQSSYTGGMLRAGIPEYRLPNEILDYEVEFIKKMGVEIKTNTPIGPELTFQDLFDKGYKSIFISIGLQGCRFLKIEGIELNNVLGGIDFLKDVNLSRKDFDFKGKTVSVIGGGSTAIDSARAAVRLGAEKVRVIYRRSEAQMPAFKYEIEEAKEEGVEFQLLANPIRLIGDKEGNLAEIECVKMKLGDLDKSGRRRPITIKGSEFKLKSNYFIVAIGQDPDHSKLECAYDDLATDKWGNILVDDLTLETSIKGVFAGGDIVSNNAVAISAIADGYEAAESINRYLTGRDLKKDRNKKEVTKKSPTPRKTIISSPRQHPKRVSVEERKTNFMEVEKPFEEWSAISEANRCLNCSVCSSPNQKIDDYYNACDDKNVQECFYGSTDPVISANSSQFLKSPKAIISFLNDCEISPVVLADEKCCGHDLFWQGDIESFKKLAKYNVNLFKKAGVKKLILSCAEGYYMWKYEYPKLFEDSDQFDIEVIHISEFILKNGLLDNFKIPTRDKVKVTYHDACRLGRLSDFYESPREILEKIPFVELIEMENIKRETKCCGVSAYLNCDIHSKEIQRERIEEAIETGAEYLLVSCPKCLAHFNCYLNEHPKAKEKIKIMDFMTFIGELLFLV